MSERLSAQDRETEKAIDDLSDQIHSACRARRVLVAALHVAIEEVMARETKPEQPLSYRRSGAAGGFPKSCREMTDELQPVVREYLKRKLTGDESPEEVNQLVQEFVLREIEIGVGDGSTE